MTPNSARNADGEQIELAEELVPPTERALHVDVYGCRLAGRGLRRIARLIKVNNGRCRQARVRRLEQLHLEDGLRIGAARSAHLKDAILTETQLKGNVPCLIRSHFDVFLVAS